MNNTEEHVEETQSEGLIKTPKQLIVTVILAFIIPILVIVLLTHLVATTSRQGAGANSQTEEAIANRIKPVADFRLVDANAPKEFKTGQQVYESTCTACHSAGVAGAPKLGDKDAWAPFIANGYEDLVHAAIHGVNAMPPKGGNPSLDDFEVERAVVYIANQSGASFDEPQEPTADGGDEAAEQASEAPAAPAEQPADANAQPDAQAETQAADEADAVQPDAESAEASQPAADEAAAPAKDTAAVDPAGEKLYKSVCFACHDAGIAGAPKFGDKDAWAKYIETGMDSMLAKAISGVGAMPPRGGSQASDEEIAASIQYMVDAAQ